MKNVSRSDLAKILGLSANRVSELKEEGVIDVLAGGRYNPLDSARRYIEYRRAKATERQQSGGQGSSGGQVAKVPEQSSEG